MNKPIAAVYAGLSQDVPVLSVRGLSVAYDGRETVHDVSFDIGRGEVVALVGESGSGKSTTAQAIIGLLPENGRLTAGRIVLNGEDISGWKGRRLDTIRGTVVSLVPQDPGSSLNPLRTIGSQLTEIWRLHGHRDTAAIRQEAVELLGHVGLSHPELRFGQYPHELSGGMKQRVLIAIALALKPALIIADEPTSALDVTVQKRILDLIDKLRVENGTSVLLVTHDLAVAGDRADRIVVLKGGAIQEADVSSRVLGYPASAYTRQLLADIPSRTHFAPRPAIPRAAAPIIEVRNLVQDFDAAGGPFRAVDDVSFSVLEGTTHALVGESGSGKTTTARAVAGLSKPTRGQVFVNGRDITALRGEPLRQFRREVQLVYQNPFASLDPRQTVGEIIAEPLRNFGRPDRAERRARVLAALEQVQLAPELAERRPAALSGGQRQRVAIARALILSPRLLVLDEAVSALDVTVQAQILRLLDGLQRDLKLTYLFVSHDLSVVRGIADTVTVMQSGKAVETGEVQDVFEHGRAEYTRALIRSIPGGRYLER
ncbi:dipeptide ABC transporter ATP-binding protein [Paenirhodobacter populi]|uniref:dipeptide ABC transporter ATP-binding protein n=1 Tax=Paenirhodobacter populi TaxID=2306993 RepID=UPI000FE356B2|nr:ABC transporter ATP-binding protein [Sinirhodobacter populi]RWR05243.1 ABC transporter ATP-binding protein [Sinirhodobacter populi]